MPSANESPCASEAAPAEVTVRLRSRSIHPAGRNVNRHSYHGTSTASVAPSHTILNPFSRFSQLYLAPTPSLSLPQRSPNDWEQIRCAKKRFSANFGGHLCSLPEDMNPNESNGRPFVDTMQQGPDLQESPRGSSISSASSVKREDSQPHVMGPGGMPMQGHVLVDPATGQHYIVPQAAFYQPIPAMQPMFYPPPQPQPMYYPYGQHIPPGYMMQPGSQGQQGPYPMQMQANPSSFVAQTNTRGYSSPMGQYRSGYGQTASSTEDVSRRETDEYHPPQSPVSSVAQMFPSSMFVPSQTSFAQQYRQQLVSHGSSGNLRSSPNSQPEDPESGRDGFRRDVTRSSAEFAPRSSGEFVRKGSAEFKPRSADVLPIDRTPLYGGPPQWWGREEAESLTDVESRRPRVSPPVQTTASDTEATRPAPPRAPPAPRSVRMDIDFNKVSESSKEKPAKPSVRSLRMDIDLSKPMPEEEELLKKKATPRAPATAFTVSFDQPGEGVSLQDAALKSAQVRRVLGRRSGAGPSPSQNSPQPAPTEKVPSAPVPVEESSNKKYLLSKLLHGANSNETGADLPDLEYKKDHDMVSEAGTFVVDVSARAAASGGSNMMSRVVENSDDSTDSESDTDSDDERRTPVEPPRPAPPRPVQQAPASPPKKDNILHELVKLRQMAGINANAPVKPSTPTVSIRSSRQVESPRPATTAALPPLAKRTSLGSQQQPPQPQPNRSVLGSASRAPSATSSNSTNAFRRGDGGRFSMRGGQASSPQTQQKRPPFRAGGATARTPVGNPVQQREQEMNAWLRRKDYNPMKAAAEARKAKELKSSMTDLSVVSLETEDRGEQFMSNRSMSFHVGPAAAQPRQNDFRELTRNRSQESIVENEAAEQASQRIVAEYSRGMVKDINRLTQQSAGSPGKHLTGLARAVDMLSQKCKKSIELIRNQNKGCLSVSVEDLLAAAAEPPRSDETLNDQLERLSDAFDAVQRYLEQYSLDGHQSPIPEFSEEPELDRHSMISGFSGLSFRSSQPPQNHSPRGAPVASSLAGGSPRTSGYRSRILAANPMFLDHSSTQH